MSVRLAITLSRDGTGVLSLGSIVVNLANWDAGQDGQFFADATITDNATIRAQLRAWLDEPPNMENANG